VTSNLRFATFVILSIPALCGPGSVLAQNLFPTLTEDLDLLVRLHDTVRSGPVEPARLEMVVAAKLRMAQREVPPVWEAQERREFAQAWKLIGAIGQLDCDTEEVVEIYRIAYGPNPGDDEVAAELAFRQRKLDAVNERIEEARGLREADGQAGRN